MNAKTNSITSAIKARNPQFRTPRAPRVAAAIIAIVVTLMVFDGVALLGNSDDAQSLLAANKTMVAQATPATQTR